MASGQDRRHGLARDARARSRARRGQRGIGLIRRGSGPRIARVYVVHVADRRVRAVYGSAAN